MKINLTTYLFLFLSLCLFALAGSLNSLTSRPILKLSKQKTAINLDKDLTSIFSLGQKRAITDMLWISTLLESDIEHYKSKDLNSWMFLRFLSIVTLDPKFLKAYQFGGQYLAIIKDDLVGAEKIYLKGLESYPNDYKLNFNLGFLYFHELNQPKKAIPYFEKIQNFERAPIFIKTLLIKIRHNSEKDIKLTFKLLSKLKETLQDEYLLNKVVKDLYALKAEIDLQCLNSKSKGCDYYDYNNNPYLERNGKYYDSEKYERYKLHKNK